VRTASTLLPGALNRTTFAVRCRAAALNSKSQLADTKGNLSSVDVELVIAVDVSYSMDLDELAVQREGYAQAIVSKKSFRR